MEQEELEVLSITIWSGMCTEMVFEVDDGNTEATEGARAKNGILFG